MSNILIPNRAPIPARTINQAREIAHWIAKKDHVRVVIQCAIGAFEDEVIEPS